MKILLAISGGIDSMCMLDMAPELFRESTFYVAHCNFQLRGDASDADQTLVENRCSNLGILCHTIRFDTAAYASDRGISIEMAARELRYNWFAKLCREYGYDAVAVAHNQNDNAETMMFNILRGSGGRGLRGMSKEGVVPGAPDIPLLRPLLDISRAEIQDRVKSRNIPYREDASNAENIYKRNRIRNEVFGIFKEMNPSYLTAITRTMEHIRQENDIAEEFYLQSRPGLISIIDNIPVISISALRSNAHKDYMLYRLLEPYGFNNDVLTSISRALDSDNQLSGKTFSSGSYKLVTASDRLLIVPEAKNNTPQKSITINAPGEYVLDGSTINIEVFDRPEGMELKQPSGVLIADASVLNFPLELRHWHAGDWMRPMGMKGSKKLSDMFVDLGWNLVDKARCMVICKQGSSQVLALLGTRIDDSVKVTPATTTILRIS